MLLSGYCVLGIRSVLSLVPPAGFLLLQGDIRQLGKHMSQKVRNLWPSIIPAKADSIVPEIKIHKVQSIGERVQAEVAPGVGAVQGLSWEVRGDCLLGLRSSVRKFAMVGEGLRLAGREWARAVGVGRGGGVRGSGGSGGGGLERGKQLLWQRGTDGALVY